MKYILWILIVGILSSCSHSGAPDVSNIKIELKTVRFEKDFFHIDTNDLTASLQQLSVKYKGFLNGFLLNVIGIRPDSVMVTGSESSNAIKQFIRDYQPVKDSCEKMFGSFKKWEDQIHKGLQYVKYYFPKYHVPGEIITFIGPMDAFFATSFGVQGDILTPEGIGIGLQLHLGKNFSFYHSEAGQELYPEYISYNFDPEHISINAMKTIVDDLFPEPKTSSALIEQMVNSGRKYYLLTKFLPDADEDALLGYTKKQFEGVKKNEAVIWDFFMNNDLLNNRDPLIIKNYIGPSPKTQEFGEGSPGNLGSFAGLQIVKKYMDRFPETNMNALMELPPREIYENSKYKPRS